MPLDQYLKRHGHLGSRTKGALAGWLFPNQGWTVAPAFSEKNEMVVKFLVQSSLPKGITAVRGLGYAGLLLLAKYFKIKVPKKNNSLSSLRQQLAKAKKRIKELESGEFICRSCGLRKDSDNIPADF